MANPSETQPDDGRISAPDSVVAAVSVIAMNSIGLYKSTTELCNDSMLTTLLKEESSNQAVKLGRQDHPFDMTQVKSFLTGNEHHSACIYAKVASTTGLGFVDGEEEVVVKPADMVMGTPEKTRRQFVEAASDKLLNPLCSISWADVLHDVTEDFWQTGNGYFEVIREAPGKEIVGVHHLPAHKPYIYVENANYDFHYEIVDDEGNSTLRRFARFGDGENFLQRVASDTIDFQLPTEQKDNTNITEVIHIRQPTSLSRWYGFPRWLSGVPPIELAQMLMQWKYDFFINRGVPEFMLFILGQKLQPDDWKKVEDALKANIGLGNTRKSLALNLTNPEIKIQVEKLGLEGKSDDDFGKTKESLAASIVTAHGVPPLLAGIQIPGKMGATNELPNALMAFQILVIGPAQRLFQQTLGTTFGHSEQGVKGITIQVFALHRITDQIDLQAADTVSRMRTPVAQAQAEGRRTSEGLRD